MAELATNAIEELIRLVQTDEPLWIKPGSDGREVLHLETYDRIFPKPGHQFIGPDIQVEASRDSSFVYMSPVALVDMFMDSVSTFPFGNFLDNHSTNIESFTELIQFGCRISGSNYFQQSFPRQETLKSLKLE